VCALHSTNNNTITSPGVLRANTTLQQWTEHAQDTSPAVAARHQQQHLWRPFKV